MNQNYMFQIYLHYSTMGYFKYSICLPLLNKIDLCLYFNFVHIYVIKKSEAKKIKSEAKILWHETGLHFVAKTYYYSLSI